MDRWVGKTAVVTGASAGIGAAIAVALAEAGLNVVGLARRPHLVEDLNKELKADKNKIHAKKCDVSSREEIINVFAAIDKQFGGINIVVNNAALVEVGTFTDAGETVASHEAIEMLINTNIMGVATCSREGAKYMKRTGEQGHIVNISSAACHYAPAGSGMSKLNIHYGSNHPLQLTTEAMRLEFSHPKGNIKLTSMSPGFVRTNMAKVAQEGELPADVLDSFPKLDPGDVAEAVLSVIATPPRVNISQVIIQPVGDT